MIKHPTGNDLGEDGFTLAHSSRVQFIMVGTAWKLEHEGAGHGASPVRKQREISASISIQLVFSFCAVMNSPMECCHSYLG